MTDQEFQDWLDDIERRNAETMRGLNRDYWLVATVLAVSAVALGVVRWML